MLWSEKKNAEIQLKVLKRLLDYGEIAKKRDNIQFIEQDADGWLLLEELREGELGHYLTSKRATFFLNQPFIEVRHKKAPKGTIKYRECIGKDKGSGTWKTRKGSAYRLKRTVKAWKSIYKYLYEHNATRLFWESTYRNDLAEKVEKGVFQSFLAVFDKAQLLEKGTSSQENLKFAWYLAESNPRMFYFALKEPKRLEKALHLAWYLTVGSGAKRPPEGIHSLREPAGALFPDLSAVRMEEAKPTFSIQFLALTYSINKIIDQYLEPELYLKRFETLGVRSEGIDSYMKHQIEYLAKDAQRKHKYEQETSP